MPNSYTKPLIAGNWKMNGLNASVSEFRLMLSEANKLFNKVDLLICPPVTLLQSFAQLTKDTDFSVGGQDCHINNSGAHTGDISAEMLADIGAKYCIVGHSERRADHHETNSIVHAKASAVWKSGTVAIICVGETDEEYIKRETLKVVENQLLESVPLGATSFNTVIAYEPVWAIGTGKTPTTDDVKNVHAVIRKHMTERFGEEGTIIRILYGGSVKPSNAQEILGVANVDGALVGGASLKAFDFIAIAKAAS